MKTFLFTWNSEDGKMSEIFKAEAAKDVFDMFCRWNYAPDWEGLVSDYVFNEIMVVLRHSTVIEIVDNYTIFSNDRERELIIKRNKCKTKLKEIEEIKELKRLKEKYESK